MVILIGKNMNIENVVIIGSGPAGLTAAIYTARADLSPVVVEGRTPGGQIVVSHEVENYPGFPQPISGFELMEKFREQALRFGARFIGGVAEKIVKEKEGFKVTVSGKDLLTYVIIIATGAEARRLPIPSADRFYGKGISGCATCDGAFYRDKKVIVVGGGNTAIQDAIFLTKFAREVIVVHRREYFRAERVEIEKAKSNSKIKWLIPYIVKDVVGDESVKGVILKNTRTNEEIEIDCDGVFVAIGHEPNADIVKGLVETDENGYIKVKPGSTSTSCAGIFACGDVIDPVYKQAVVAAGTGCMAGIEARYYLENLAFNKR